MVKRIVANIKTEDLSKTSVFYQDILGLETLWIKAGLKHLVVKNKQKFR